MTFVREALLQDIGFCYPRLPTNLRLARISRTLWYGMFAFLGQVPLEQANLLSELSAQITVTQVHVST